MKNTQKGFIIPLLIVVIAVLAIGAGVYVFEQGKTKQVEQQSTTNNQTIPTSTSQATTPSANQYAEWKTYSNTVYHYSIKYPNNWFVNTQYSNQDFTPRGPAPHDYIGGDTSISNYSQAQIDQYQKTNGELAYPTDYTVVSWMFWKTQTQSNLDSTPVDVDSFKKENVVINGVPGVKTTTLGQRGIGGATKPNSVGINFKLNGESVNIGYGFDSSNANVTKIADQIISSFTLDTSKIKN